MLRAVSDWKKHISQEFMEGDKLFVDFDMSVIYILYFLSKL